MQMEFWISIITLLVSVGTTMVMLAYNNGRQSEKIKNLDMNDRELKETLIEIRKTTVRLGNELNRLIGQLEGENHGRDCDTRR